MLRQVMMMNPASHRKNREGGERHRPVGHAPCIRA